MILFLTWAAAVLCFSITATILTVYMLQYKKLVPSVRWRIILLWSIAAGCFSWALVLLWTQFS